MIYAYGDDNSVILNNSFSGENAQRFTIRFVSAEAGYSETHSSAGAVMSGQSMSLSYQVIEGTANHLTDAMVVFG